MNMRYLRQVMLRLDRRIQHYNYIMDPAIKSQDD